MTAIENVVLVHGGFVDGSGWEDVYKVLKKAGYNVSIVQNPTLSLEDDVAVTKRVIATQNGPVVLVGHSYGGVVITEAGNDPKVAASFAADVPADKAGFMADSQVPWGVAALSGTITQPAWKTKPSWYLVATDDRMIPPPAQQFMSKRAGSTVVETKGSHSVYVSKPEAVAALIDKAAKGVK